MSAKTRYFDTAAGRLMLGVLRRVPFFRDMGSVVVGNREGAARAASGLSAEFERRSAEREVITRAQSLVRSLGPPDHSLN